MPIDWFTVVAQAINFLVLVALLKRFFYGPIVRAMTEREQHIAGQLADADAARRQAKQQVEALARTQREFEDRRGEMLDEAREQARLRGQDLLEEARERVAGKESEWSAELERKQDRLVEDLTDRTNDNLVVALRNVLSDLADEDLQDRVVRVFVGRIEHLDPQESSEFEQVVGRPLVTVLTAFPVSPDQERALRAAIVEAGGAAAALQFETDPTLVCGVEVRADGRRLSWSFRQAAGQAEAVVRAATEHFAEARAGA